MDKTRKPTSTRPAVVASIVFAAAGLWRCALGYDHYRAAQSIGNDPSLREFEQVSAGVEFGLALVLLVHAVAIAALGRRPLRIHVAAMAGVAVLAAVSVAGALLRAPIAFSPGLTTAALLVAATVCGYLVPSVWMSAYLGAVLGAGLGYAVAVPETDPVVALAVILPPAITVLLGSGLGALGRRRWARG